jgi:hypothetical protein
MEHLPLLATPLKTLLADSLVPAHLEGRAVNETHAYTLAKQPLLDKQRHGTATSRTSSTKRLYEATWGNR